MRSWIVLVVMVGLGLAGCGSRLTRRGPLDPSLSAFVSSDTVILVGVRMDQVRATSLYRALAARQRVPPFGNFPAEAGFDPATDVNELLLASDGARALAVAHGDFKGKKPSNLASAPYKGYTLFSKDERDAIAFIDERTVLGGPLASVRAAIDQWKAGGRGAPPDLVARAQALPADTQIWAVVAGWKGADAATLRGMGNAANLDRVLRSVEGASLTVDLRTGIHAAGTGDCRTEADAQSLSESLRGLAGIARIGVPRNRPELLRVFDGIRVKQEGSAVKLNVDVPQDVAAQLLK